MIDIRIIVGEETNVSDSLSFEVILVVNGRIVLPSGWLGFADLGDKCSECVVNELGFHVFIDVEIADGIDGLNRLVSFSSGSPFVFNSCNMPLVDNSDDLLSWSVSVESVEEVSVFLIDDDFLLVRCKFLEVFHEPVDSRSVDTLSVSFRTDNVKSSISVVMLSSPECVMQSSIAIPELADRIHSRFNFQGSESDIINL